MSASLISLTRWCLGHRRSALFLLVLLMVGSATGLPRLAIRADARSLLISHEHLLSRDKAVREHFHVDDPVLLAVHNPHGSIYHPPLLDHLVLLTETISSLDFVRPESVISLATEKFADPRKGSLKFPALLERRHDPAGVAQVRDYVRKLGIYSGTLVSLDETSAAILFYLDAGPGDRSSAIEQLVRLATRHSTDDLEVTLAGVPVAESLLGEHIARDFARFFPLGVLAICAVIWLAFGRWEYVAISAINVAAVNLFTFGLLGHFVGFVEITTSVLPAFMAFVAVVDDIHIFSHVSRPGGRPQVVEALKRLHQPLVLTSLTTCVGFSSFAVSTIPAIRNFGLFAAAGSIFALVWSFTFTPLVLMKVSTREPAPADAPLARAAAYAQREIRRLADRGSRAAVWGVIIILFLLGGLNRLQVQDGWEQGFSPRSTFARHFAEINRSFSGSHVLYVQVKAQGGERPFAQPALLLRMGEIESSIAGLPGVGGVAGPYRYLSAVASARGRPEMASRPEGGDVERLIVALDLALGRARRLQILDEDLQAALITVFLGRSDYRTANQVMTKIERLDTGVDLQIAFAGGVAVGRVVIGALVHSLVAAALIAPLLSSLLLTLVYRSAIGAAVCLPTLVSVGCVLGLMGWLGIPLGVATSVYLAVTLGVGVDFAVHLIEQLRRPETTSDRITSAIMVDTAAVVSCVLVLVLSTVPATYRLGWLAAISITCSSFLSLWIHARIHDRVVRSRAVSR